MHELDAIEPYYNLCESCATIAENDDSTALDMLPTDRAAELHERITKFFERVGHVVMLDEIYGLLVCDACGLSATAGYGYGVDAG